MNDDRGPWPFVTVVLPAEHDEGDLSDCITSLLQMDYPKDRYEVVLVGASEAGLPGTRSIDGIRVVEATEQGVSRWRNAGVKASRGDIVAFTDTDCAVSTSWLRELVRLFDDPVVGAVAGAVVPFPPQTDTQRYAARRGSHSPLRPLSGRHPFGMMPNLAFRRGPLVETGGFDPRFRGGGWEDADLCWRFSRHTGLGLRYAPRAVVLHRYRATPKAFFVQHYRYGFGLGLIYRKHGRELDWRWPSEALAFVEIGRTAARWAVLSGKQKVSRVADPSGAVSDAKFDCLRALGQRMGFLHALAATALRVHFDQEPDAA